MEVGHWQIGSAHPCIQANQRFYVEAPSYSEVSTGAPGGHLHPAGQGFGESAAVTQAQ
jgi:hypothetical protein